MRFRSGIIEHCRIADTSESSFPFQIFLKAWKKFRHRGTLCNVQQKQHILDLGHAWVAWTGDHSLSMSLDISFSSKNDAMGGFSNILDAHFRRILKVLTRVLQARKNRS